MTVFHEIYKELFNPDPDKVSNYTLIKTVKLKKALLNYIKSIPYDDRFMYVVFFYTKNDDNKFEVEQSLRASEFEV